MSVFEHVSLTVIRFGYSRFLGVCVVYKCRVWTFSKSYSIVKTMKTAVNVVRTK